VKWKIDLQTDPYYDLPMILSPQIIDHSDIPLNLILPHRDALAQSVREGGVIGKTDFTEPAGNGSLNILVRSTRGMSTHEGMDMIVYTHQ